MISMDFARKSFCPSILASNMGNQKLLIMYAIDHARNDFHTIKQ